MKRFVKAEGKILQTVKLTLQPELQYNTAIPEGIFIDSLYYQPYEFARGASESFVASTVKSLDTLVETSIPKQPVHIVAKSINLKPAQTKNQKVTDETVKEHMTLIHLTVRSTSNKGKWYMTLEGFEWKIWTIVTIDSGIRISILQINICGLSHHCKLAIDAYLEKHKPDVVFLNESKKEVPETAFTNYTA